MIVDLVGKKFNKLLILEFAEFRGSRSKPYWKCLCDCGNIKIIQGESIKSGTTTSCGCNFKYFDNQSSKNHLFSNYKSRARRSNLKFELSFCEFEKLTQNICFYCEQKPQQIIKPSKYSQEFIYNGIDRINNSKGYIKNNVVTCCKLCNTMKGVLDKEVFLNHVKKIYNIGKKYGWKKRC